MTSASNPNPTYLESAPDCKLICVGQLARILDVSPRTLWRWRKNRKLVKPIKIGGSTRWRLADVRRWIEAGCPPDDEQPV